MWDVTFWSRVLGNQEPSDRVIWGVLTGGTWERCGIDLKDFKIRV